MPRVVAEQVVMEAKGEPKPKAAVTSPKEALESVLARTSTDAPDVLKILVEGFLAAAQTSQKGRRAYMDVGHVVGLRLTNWVCYPGVQELLLKDVVYSLTAELEGNADRSNWCGKSSFLSAFVFALTGKYPSKLADDWIHASEKEGAVDIEFSSGIFVSRSKVRGKSIQVEVQHGDKVYTGKAADTFLSEHVIDPDIFEKTDFFTQKMTNQFLKMGTTDITNMFVEWMDLAWVDDAASSAQQVVEVGR
jgi:hypothetical protein